jgi:ribose-phosphate pyrophosphokinase
MQFGKVILFDVHSDVSTMLINNCINIFNEQLVKTYSKENAVLICPDAGASKKMGKYFDWNHHITDIVYCNKSRDLSNGAITLKVLEPEKCTNRNCIIIDDICDGGGTFMAIASQIEAAHLTLTITHGIFSKGFTALEEQFDEIIVSDSYCKLYESNIVRLISTQF